MKQASFLRAALFILALILLTPQNSQAHRLNVYAWLEGNQIVVESNFGKEHPAKNAQIRVLDSDTQRVLLQGQTSANGVYTFPVPQVVRDGHGLTIEVNAGQGHFSNWKMTASELYAAASLTAGFDQENIDKAREQAAQPGGAYQIPQNQALDASRQNQQAATQESAVAAQNIPMPNVSDHEQMRGIIEETIAKHLRPVHQAIAQQNSAGPSIITVIGGLGWIVGLVGLFLYFRIRKEHEHRENTEK